MAFAFYRVERAELKRRMYPYDQWEMDPGDAHLLVTELCRVYGVPTPKFRLGGLKWNRCFFEKRLIRIGDTRGRYPYVQTTHSVAHEVAHWIRYTVAGDKRHSKELMALIMEIVPVANLIYGNLILEYPPRFSPAPLS